MARRSTRGPATWLADTAYYLVLLWFRQCCAKRARLHDSAPSACRARVIAGALLASPLAIPEGVLPEQSVVERYDCAAYDDATPRIGGVIALQRQLQTRRWTISRPMRKARRSYFIAFAADGNAAARLPRRRRHRDVSTQWRTEAARLPCNDYATLTETPMQRSPISRGIDRMCHRQRSRRRIVISILAPYQCRRPLRVALPPLGLMQLSGASLAYCSASGAQVARDRRGCLRRARICRCARRR